MVVTGTYSTMDEERRHIQTELPSKYNYMMKLQPVESDDASTDSWQMPLTMKSSASLVSADTLPSYYGASRRPSHEDLGYQEPSHLSFGNNTLVFTATRRKNPAYIAMIIFSVFGLFMYSRSHAILHSALKQASIMSLERRNVDSMMKILEHDLRKSQRTIITLSQRQAGKQTKQTSEPSEAVEIMMDIQEKIKSVNSTKDSLLEYVQKQSREDGEVKYGTGIVRVEFDLAFPGSQEGPTSFVVQMAPLYVMPHSVFMFLERVDNKLYDGSSFILNDKGRIKASPLSYNTKKVKAASKQAFSRIGLDAIAFKEYSSDYPNQKNTLGFEFDGTPSFFINTQDNSEVHTGDPCFATIIAGFDTVKRLEQAPKRTDGTWYKKRIGIKSARIL